MTIKEGWTGRVYEDFEVGDVYPHTLGRTVLAADNMWFTLLTQNTNPIHVDRAYAEKTQELIRATAFESLPLREVVMRAQQDMNTELFNSAAQAWNHALFWNSLIPHGGGEPRGGLADAIDLAFGGFASLRTQLIDAATKQFGSGWVWLVVRHGKLAVQATSNADTPMVRGEFALLTIDVWEHAYYLDWQHERAGFVTAVIDRLLDWNSAAERY